MATYILNDSGVPILENNTLKWAVWFQNAKRTVAATAIGNDICISTVFLGMDHNFAGEPPILWETMVFRKLEGCEMDRCSGDFENAKIMHAKMVKKIKQER